MPLFHRFGTLWGALTSILTLYAYFFASTCLFGTDSGVQLGYLLAASLVVVLTERILLSAVLGVLAVLLVAVLQIMVPYNTGLLDSAKLFTTFVGTVIAIVASSMTFVTFALREAAQAEANLEDKSRGHPVELQSNPGRGSRFSVSVPLAAELRSTVPLPVAPHAADLARGKRVMVIDDDVLVLDGMRGILQSWGCCVQIAASGAAALAIVVDGGGQPDLIISDLRFADGENGIEVIERLRKALGTPVPAFVISGDTAPERLREASAGGYYLLQKSVSPMTLRTTLNRLLKNSEARAPSPHASVG